MLMVTGLFGFRAGDIWISTELNFCYPYFLKRRRKNGAATS